MNEKDIKLLGHMLEAAKFAVDSVQNKTRSDLDKERHLTLSLIKSLEMVGEAAARVSKECQMGCEPIPWEQVIEMKHQVVHTFWDIDRNWVWERVTRDLLTLIEALEKILPPRGE
jgi:uncharacterized protein with HEPN domain